MDEKFMNCCEIRG